MNALKHGFCSEVVRVPEDQETLEARSRSLLHALKPQNPFHAWLLDEAATLTLKIDRCERIERRDRDVASLRAESSWDDDRMADARSIARGLAGDPERVVEALRKTPQGCDWLLERWAMLARAADRDPKVGWSVDQRRLAFDLLGAPPEFRDGRPGEVVDAMGRVVDDGSDPALVARKQVEELLERREAVSGEDALARSMAEADLVDAPTTELRLLRRYETTLHGRLRWCLGQIATESPRLRANSDLVLNYFAPRSTEIEPPIPAVDLTPLSAPAVPPSAPRRPGFVDPPSAPFELEPHEVPPVGVAPDFPAILNARREQKIRKAESRRQSRRKKLERLLA